MKQNFWVYILLILLASFFQVGVAALPLGMALLLVWFFTNGDHHLVVLAVAFSIFLSILSTIPAYLVLATVFLALLIVFVGKNVFPSNRFGNAVLFALALVVWEGSNLLLQIVKL